AYIDPKEQKEFLARLTEAEDWLYEEGEDASHDAYIEKVSGLKATGEPIVERYREDKERPKAARELRDAVSQWADRATSQEERYSHITSEERQKIIDRIEKVQEWLDEKLEKQSTKSKWDAPVVFANEIRKQRDELVYFATPIMSRPKPAPAPVPKIDETADADVEVESPKSEGEPKGNTEQMDVD
ncbi:adenyl-nucleotide exchange factor sse1, partial [Kickxella alabastrina]